MVAAFEGYTGIWQLDKNKSPDRDKQSAWCRTEITPYTSKQDNHHFMKKDNQ